MLFRPFQVERKASRVLQHFRFVIRSLVSFFLFNRSQSFIRSIIDDQFVTKLIIKLPFNINRS